MRGVIGRTIASVAAIAAGVGMILWLYVLSGIQTAALGPWHLAIEIIAIVLVALGALGLLWEGVELRRWVSERVEKGQTFTGDLAVAIEEERFTSFKHKALIGEIKVAVHNNSTRQMDLTGFVFETSDPAGFSLHTDAEVMEEVRRLAAPRARLGGIIEPGETIYGWRVHAFPRRPAGGRPGYEVSVEDSVGNKYGLVVPSRPKREYIR